MAEMPNHEIVKTFILVKDLPGNSKDLSFCILYETEYAKSTELSLKYEYYPRQVLIPPLKSMNNAVGRNTQKDLE
jgi:hypothetical protein